jgi:hypothetical protein
MSLSQPFRYLLVAMLERRDSKLTATMAAARLG